jgi:hypothetical protein
MTATVFDIYGPFDVPFTRAGGGRIIDKDDAWDFFEDNDEFADAYGCYVFGMRAGRGFTPWYVGKATGSFQSEVFTADKLTKYHRVLVQYARGTPVVFFIVPDIGRGRRPTNRIDELESYLIGEAEAANPHIVNVQGRDRASWRLRGLGGGKGRLSAAAKAFRRMMQW